MAFGKQSHPNEDGGVVLNLLRIRIFKLSHNRIKTRKKKTNKKNARKWSQTITISLNLISMYSIEYVIEVKKIMNKVHTFSMSIY